MSENIDILKTVEDLSVKNSELNLEKPDNKCYLFISTTNQKPSYSTGPLWLNISNTGYFIRVEKRPSKIQQFFLKKLLGIELYEPQC